jgi:hypothetical protein
MLIVAKQNMSKKKSLMEYHSQLEFSFVLQTYVQFYNWFRKSMKHFMFNIKQYIT